MHVDENSPLGLAPSAAQDWLDLQRELALVPERFGSQIRKGTPPRVILSKLRSQGGLRSPQETVRAERASTDRRRLEALGIRVVPLPDPAYPRPLAELTDSPLVLLVRGQLSALSWPAIAIVGARAATIAARATARRLARELAGAGLTIVSGLARGIDAEAHRGALEAGGRTLGVLACGLDRIYPPEHRQLVEEMLENGAILSEMPLGVAPRREFFPLRNRIISGLCLATIVVEARRRSGSLITVRHALNQGREVFVVPGSIDGPFAEGTNQLLRDGARPIRSGSDVIEDLGLQGPMILPREVSAESTSAAGEEPEVESLEARILARLARGPTTRNDLLAQADRDAVGLASALLELELAGRVVEERDGRIHRVWC